MTATGGALRRPALSHFPDQDIGLPVPPARLLREVEITGECWFAQPHGGAHAPRYWWDGGWWSFRKLMWITVNGPLTGITTDGAKCRSPRCVNPQHIRTRSVVSTSQRDVPESLSYLLTPTLLRPSLSETHNAIRRLSEADSTSHMMCWIEFYARSMRHAGARSARTSTSSSRASSLYVTPVSPSKPPTSQEQSRLSSPTRATSSTTSTSAPGSASVSETAKPTRTKLATGSTRPLTDPRLPRTKPTQQGSRGAGPLSSRDQLKLLAGELVRLAMELEPEQYQLKSGWLHKAACRGEDTRQFFATGKNGDNVDPNVYAICHDCPVQLNCLAHALRAPEPFGVWGGLSPSQRHRYGRWAATGGR